MRTNSHETTGVPTPLNQTPGHHPRRSGWALVGLAGGVVAAAAMSLSAAVPASASSSGVDGTVDADGGLRGHTVPSTHAPTFQTLADGSDVRIDCQINSTQVSGNATWYQLVRGGWISGEYVHLTGESPDFCTPGTSSSVTVTKSTTAYEGPSSSDRTAASIPNGDFEAWCYASTHVPGPGNDKNWIAGVESGRISGDAVAPSEGLPACYSS